MGEVKDTSDPKYTINLNKAWALSKSWKNSAIIWRTLDHLFAIGAFSFSILVVYICTIEIANRDIFIVFFSSLSAVLSLVGFACNPTKYMQGYRMAFQILNDALISNTDEYGNIKSKNGYEEIGDAIKQAERYIGTTFEVGKALNLVDYSHKSEEEIQAGSQEETEDADLPR